MNGESGAGDSDRGYYELRLDPIPFAEIRAAYGLLIALATKLTYWPLCRLFGIHHNAYVRVPETVAEVTIAEADIPASHRGRLDEAAAEFEKDGFTRVAYFAQRDVLPSTRSYSLSLLNPDETICLTITSTFNFDDTPLALNSTFASVRRGVRISTDDAPKNAIVREDTDLQREPEASPRELYEKHRERMRLSGREKLTKEDIGARVLDNIQVAYRDLITRGMMKPVSQERIATIRSSPPPLPTHTKLRQVETRAAKAGATDGELVLYYYVLTPVALAAYVLGFASAEQVDPAGRLFAGALIGVWGLYTLGILIMLGFQTMIGVVDKRNPAGKSEPPVEISGHMSRRTRIMMAVFGTLLWGIHVFETWF